jgi:hypothetical protein
MIASRRRLRRGTERMRAIGGEGSLSFRPHNLGDLAFVTRKLCKVEDLPFAWLSSKMTPPAPRDWKPPGTLIVPD